MTAPAVTCSILSPIYKETELDYFASGTAVLDGVSITARPDAISLDYQTAFTYGPPETGSTSGGLLTKVWRVRNQWQNNSGTVFFQREADSGGFRSELPLFTYTGSQIQELDVAFTSDGRFTIAANRLTGNATSSVSGSDIWLYWFSPFANTFVFQNFGQGTTPRVILDSPEIPDTSDIILLYIRDDLGRVYYRQLRDQYAIEYWVPVPVPSSVNGSLTGSLDGAISGSLLGNASGTFSPFLSGGFSGEFIGTGSGGSFGTLAFEQFNGPFTGSMFGEFIGSLSGTLTGSLNGNVVTAQSASFIGTLGGFMTGSFNGQATGSIRRVRSGQISGSFTGFITGTITGSMIGQTDRVSRISDSITGQISGSMSGLLAGDIVGFPSGTQQAFFTTYLEDAVKLRDGRIAFFYSQRNALSGRYRMRRFESLLYPLPADPEQLAYAVTYVTSSLRNIVLNYGADVNVEASQFFADFATGSIRNIVLNYGADVNVEASQFFADFVTGSIRNIVADYGVGRNIDASQFFADFSTGSIRNIVILHTNYDKEAITSMSLSLISASLT